MDIDKLHSAVDLINNQLPRAQRERGISYAYRELMVGEAQLGDPNSKYLYVGESRVISERMQDSFVARLQEVEVEVTKVSRLQQRVELTNGMVFVFCGSSQLVKYSFVRGHSFDRVFFDVAVELRSGDFITKAVIELAGSVASQKDII